MVFSSPPAAPWGKDNIEFKPSSRVAVTFTRSGRRVELLTRDDVLKELDHVSSQSQAEKLCEILLERTDERLFIIRLE